MTPTLCRWVTSTYSKLFIQSVRRFRTTYFARKVFGCTTLGLAFAKCDGLVPVEGFKTELLTREQCIKQACLLTVNSASTLLTTTSSALLDICKEYKDSLSRMLTLLEQLQVLEGENPQLWDAVVETRASVNKAKAALTELNCYMETVEKVVTSTTEAAFLAGAEYMCTALCERLYSAQKEIQTQIEELKKLEEQYMKMQKEIVSTTEENKSKSKTKRVVAVEGKNIL